MTIKKTEFKDQKLGPYYWIYLMCCFFNCLQEIVLWEFDEEGVLNIMMDITTKEQYYFVSWSVSPSYADFNKSSSLSLQLILI